MRKRWRWIVGIVAGLAAIRTAMIAIVRPSNVRDWTIDQKTLPVATFDGPLVTIRNIRNFQYENADRFTPAWYDKTFDLRRLESAWFVVEPFGGPVAAHTFVSFGFGDDDFVAISVEIRKEKGEAFSPLKGLLRQYEIMYVVGDERDLIKLRSNVRKDPVYLYPMRTTPERMRAMFVSMLKRADDVAQHPEFYNTLTNTCTTNLVRHVNALMPGRIPLHPAVFLPGYSDRLAYKLGLIDTNLPFEQARESFHINSRAEKFANDPQFSLRIRQ
ncbi:MAG: hypothetical protein DMF56_15535 [Acidobacteria bacterium]|nr:MAG: hypothetical protein DMF56_15535 [Acidobacteriota bacterium]